MVVELVGAVVSPVERVLISIMVPFFLLEIVSTIQENAKQAGAELCQAHHRSGNTAQLSWGLSFAIILAMICALM